MPEPQHLWASGGQRGRCLTWRLAGVISAAGHCRRSLQPQRKLNLAGCLLDIAGDKAECRHIPVVVEDRRRRGACRQRDLYGCCVLQAPVWATSRARRSGGAARLVARLSLLGERALDLAAWPGSLGLYPGGEGEVVAGYSPLGQHAGWGGVYERTSRVVAVLDFSQAGRKGDTSLDSLRDHAGHRALEFVDGFAPASGRPAGVQWQVTSSSAGTVQQAKHILHLATSSTSAYGKSGRPAQLPENEPPPPLGAGEGDSKPP
jgi:hypothetical protein